MRRIHGAFFCVSILFFAEGCAHVRPGTARIPGMPSNVELRQGIYERYSIHKKDEDKPPSNGFYQWFEDTHPRLESQNPDLKAVKLLQLDQYFRQAGAGEAAELAEEGNRRGFAAMGCAAVMVGTAVAWVGNGGYDGRDQTVGEGALPLAALFACAELWLLHDATVDYYYPAVGAYNRWLQDRLDIALEPERSGSRVQLGWRY